LLEWSAARSALKYMTKGNVMLAKETLPGKRKKKRFVARRILTTCMRIVRCCGSSACKYANKKSNNTALH
jgi:hypothetical protein